MASVPITSLVLLVFASSVSLLLVEFPVELKTP